MAKRKMHRLPPRNADGTFKARSKSKSKSKMRQSNPDAWTWFQDTNDRWVRVKSSGVVFSMFDEYDAHSVPANIGTIVTAMLKDIHPHDRKVVKVRENIFVDLFPPNG